MTGIEKAATILNIIDPEIAGRLLQLFNAEDIEKISSITKSLEPIDSSDFANLIEEFSALFANDLQMLGVSRDVNNLLESVLTPAQVSKLKPQKAAKGSVWTNESFAKQEILTPIVRTEHPQLVAAILSQLDSDLTSELIASFSNEERNDILQRMLNMREIKMEVTSIIEDHFRTTIIENDEEEKGGKSRARMANIINKMDKTQADKFLFELAIEEPEEAARLKKLLFSFEDIPILSQKDRLILFDSVETDTSILALDGINGEMKELILESFGTRVRKMIESELASSDPKDAEKVDKARRKIANIALNLASKGNITIVIKETN